MKKGLIFCVLLVALASMFAVEATMGQPRPYGSKVYRSSDTISTIVAKGFTTNVWYFFCMLNDDASGTGYLTTYYNETANETCAVHIRPGFGWVSYAQLDSFRFTKADSSDCFSWEAAR